MVNAGIDIGGTNIKIGLVDTESLKLIAKKSIPFIRSKTDSEIFDNIRKETLELTEKCGLAYEGIATVGICVPGSINPSENTVINAHNLGFHDLKLRAVMEMLFPGKSVNIANDANSAAMAELKAGALAGTQTSLLLTIGTGLGSGIILNGSLFNGGLNHGVEIGHMAMDIHGEMCTCNNRGCAETLCTASWLTAKGKNAAKKHPDSFLAMRANESGISVNAKTVIDGARLGDEIAMEIFNEFTDNLSTAIASICNMLDPQRIAIGGGVSMSGDILYVPLKIKVKEKSFFNYDYDIVPAQMGNDAGMIGAALLGC